ncbi:MAG: potassium transporter Kup [Bacteroidetes bacterium]|nr:potassium transporter Kup [Bacteroidota bacterium]
MPGKHLDLNKVTGAGLLITLGIIFGDIGTSPLYVLKSIIDTEPVTPQLVLGGLSCIFWTLTLQTTVKYIILTLRADNKGEGGILALYALLKGTKKKWLIFLAIIGGSTLLADGLITPPISVASAVEGLKILKPELNTIPIVIVILVILFFIQQFGTKFVGKFFGPVMLTWFCMLGTLGIFAIAGNITVLKALNPYYAWELLAVHPGGFWLLGSVFLATTGAEALYSDLGHCGKKNIRVSWGFVKVMLLLNYFGQGAWLLSIDGNLLGDRNPFYLLMPQWFVPFGILIATAATIVASQALISGSFTLINEAMRLNFWPKVRIKYPTELKGQLYIPSVNWLLCVGCIAVVLYFKESENMEAAYGLAIVITMIMTTLLLCNYLLMKKYAKLFVYSLLLVYLLIEVSFLIANLSKFEHGGWITLMIATLIALVMVVWFNARKIMNRYVEFTQLSSYTAIIEDLSRDSSLEKFSTHLVFMTSADNKEEIEEKVIYSILNRQPKRADIYWLVHLDLVNEPYCMEYHVTPILKEKIMRVDFRLGFREALKVNMLFRQVIQDLMKSKEINGLSRYESLSKHRIMGDFRFVVMKKFMSNENELPILQSVVMEIYFFLKRISLSEEKAFGLDTSNVVVERTPLIIRPPGNIRLERVETEK